MMIDVILIATGSQATGKTRILNEIQDYFRSKGLIAEFKNDHELLINGEVDEFRSGQLKINWEKTDEKRET